MSAGLEAERSSWDACAMHRLLRWRTRSPSTSARATIAAIVMISSVRCTHETHGLELSRQEGTVMELRTVARALELYAIEHRAYPRATTLTSLRDSIEPYLEQLNLKDAWGNELRYVAWQEDAGVSGPDHFRLASAGRGGEWEQADLTMYPERVVPDFSGDLVCGESGRFIQQPQWLISETHPGGNPPDQSATPSVNSNSRSRDQ